jgi:hypothetical protein
MSAYLEKKTLDKLYFIPFYQTDDHRYHRNNKEDVDKSASDVIGEKGNSPNNYKNNSD